jgi:23S rRNA pseudouridine2605 synthase
MSDRARPSTGSGRAAKRVARLGAVPLARALSKLGILSRTQATVAIRDGRVRVDGRVVRDPARLVVPERARILVDGEPKVRAEWRTIVFHKPRGVVTTRRDPEGRTTIYDVLGDAASGLVPIGRLDRASTGLLMLTSDTHLANWITDPANAVPRTYVVTVRGDVTPDLVARLPAANVVVRKSSRRETHLTVELRQGKNREVRRMFEAIGREVTRLKRVAFGRLELGGLEPAAWRELSKNEICGAFPGATLSF